MLAHLGETLFAQFATLVEQAIGIVDVVNDFGRETATTQPHKIETAISHWVTGSHDVGRNVLAGACAASHHDIAAYVAELVDEDIGTDDGKVVDHDLTGDFRGISDDATITDFDVVGHVHTFHKQVVAAHDSAAFGGRTTVDGDVLADGVVVAYLGCGFLTLEFEVLGDGTDDSTGKYDVVAAHTGAAKQRDAIHQFVAVADNDILVDIAERTDFAIFANDGLFVYESQRADLTHVAVVWF